jgi:hypothetical protein
MNALLIGGIVIFAVWLERRRRVSYRRIPPPDARW